VHERGLDRAAEGVAVHLVDRRDVGTGLAAQQHGAMVPAVSSGWACGQAEAGPARPAVRAA
jgi:hypothetical protein